MNPPDPIRPLVYGVIAAAGGGVLWGVHAMKTGALLNPVALAAGLLIGTTLNVSARRLRGRRLQVLAVVLTLATALLALYLAFFGALLTEVSEHYGHDRADKIPVTTLFTPDFMRDFATAVPKSLPWPRVAWLTAGMLAAAILTRRPGAPDAS